MASNSSALTEESADVQQRLLDAAESCFEQFGLAKTTMEDVAQSAGMSRATVYRYFKNRDELLMGVVEREAARTAKVIKRRLAGIQNPGEYIVEGVVQSLVEIPKRPALSITFNPDVVGMASRLVLNDERLANIALELVLPVIEPARAKGILRESVDVNLMIEWIFRIIASYITVPSPQASTEEELRILLRKLLLPALLK